MVLLRSRQLFESLSGERTQLPVGAVGRKFLSVVVRHGS
jgi:hypothetical protein